jgi:N-acetylmuramoyl-L-alanine amidase
MHLRTGMIMLIALAMHFSSDAKDPASAQATASVAKSEAPNCDRHTFRVVVDVGHTVRVPGALSARGVYEYEFNLRLAKEVAQKLKDSGFERTVLLITSDAETGVYRYDQLVVLRSTRMPAVCSKQAPSSIATRKSSWKSLSAGGSSPIPLPRPSRAIANPTASALLLRSRMLRMSRLFRDTPQSPRQRYTRATRHASERSIQEGTIGQSQRPSPSSEIVPNPCSRGPMIEIAIENGIMTRGILQTHTEYSC